VNRRKPVRSLSTRDQLTETGKEEVMQVLPEGQYIKHVTYGLGIVTEADAERTTIHFQSYGAKKFVTSIMTAEILGETPKKPIKVKRRSKKTVARAKAAVA
jgi:hypothetical protein